MSPDKQTDAWLAPLESGTTDLTENVYNSVGKSLMATVWQNNKEGHIQEPHIWVVKHDNKPGYNTIMAVVLHYAGGGGVCHKLPGWKPPLLVWLDIMQVKVKNFSLTENYLVAVDSPETCLWASVCCPTALGWCLKHEEAPCTASSAISIV